ncbi:MAG: cytidine deaminase [Cytophagales bacterium]|nr:cytidine deaminase [Bernardetiaceae bacterium]MDW8210620.1 cytidine deaminase [Cytophagales bacterium]
MPKAIHLHISFWLYSCLEELPEKERFVLETARRAISTAYAPYSGFCVGAAALLSNGVVVIGSNQENAAYPSGLCAERTALFAAGAHYSGQTIEMLAVSAQRAGENRYRPAHPCGACCQVIAEYQDRQQKSMRIIMEGEDGQIRVVDGVEALLPFRFGKHSL